MFAWHDTPWMWLSMLVFWSLFAVFAYFAIRGWLRPTAAQSGPRAAAILEERYARGEISAEEYGTPRDDRGQPHAEEGAVSTAVAPSRPPPPGAVLDNPPAENTPAKREPPNEAEREYRTLMRK